MGRIYTAVIKTASVSAAKTLLLITCPADAVYRIVEAHVAAPEDDTNEQLEACFQRVNVLGSPAGTSVTPAPHSKGDAAAGATVLGDLSAEPTSYVASTEWGRRGFSSLGGYHFEPPPDTRPEVSPGDSVGLRLLGITSAKVLSVEVVLEELGG